MKRNSVKVCVRTRPTQYFAQDNLFLDEELNTIQISTSSGEETPGVLNNKRNNFKFKFDHIFHNATQSSVYDLYARDTVQGVIDGINGAIMTYGQTGSGKTFTMMGDTQSYEHRGVAPRSLNQLFSEVNSRLEIEYKISCTYMEIYNERIFDLLTDLSNPDQASDLTIIEEKDGRGTFVRGLTEVEVKSEVEAFNLMFSGELARTTATHKLNRKSNRSHSVFTVYLQQRQRSGVSERVLHSKLHLVDLAGSERLKKTMDSSDGLHGYGSNDVTRKESMCINQSLTYLEQCVVALSRRGTNHIPYRQSKLTNILKDCLGANCMTLMISCIWGEATHLEETVSTLRLASRMMKVQNESTKVETVDAAALIRKQAKIIKALKQELLMHDALVERTGMEYEPYTPEQQSNIVHMLDRYVDAAEADEEDMLNINSYRQIIEVCKVFKKMVLTERSETKLAREDAMYNSMPRSSNGRPLSSAGNISEFGLDGKFSTDDFNSTGNMVGEADSSKRLGFSVGTALSDSKPAGGVEGISKFTHKLSGAISHGQESNNANVSSKAGAGAGGLSPDRDRKGARVTSFDIPADSKAGGRSSDELSIGGNSNALLENYIGSEGAAVYDEFVEAKAQLKDLKQKSKDVGILVNTAKVDIDRLQRDVDARKTSRIELLRKSGLKSSETEDIVDEEEFKLMKDLREAKRSYKNAFEQLQKYKTGLSLTQTYLEDAKSNLASGFSAWSTRTGQGGVAHSDDIDDRDNDQLDDQEAFDKLEMERLLAGDPDSFAFFNAQKTRRAHITQHGGSIKQIQKNKRFR